MSEINKNAEEQEIDLIELIKRLWSKKKFIVKVTACFMVIGVLVALSAAKVYTADCVIVPQTGDNMSAGGLSSMAAMVGISMGGMSESEQLSPKMYPEILKNINFQKELMYTKVKFDKWEEPISLYEYYTNEEYATMSFFGVIFKYTFGLPGVIIGAIRGETKPVEMESIGTTLNMLTQKEYECSNTLSEIVSLEMNDKDGYITLTANMPEAIASAEVCEAAYLLLQKYITMFKIAKAQDSFDFIQDSYKDAKSDFEKSQIAYARFRDANRLMTSEVVKIRQEQLKSEYELAKTIYTELAKQLLQANLKVKEDTPILTAVKPVTVPNQSSKPQRSMILVVWTFLGGIMACGSVFALDFIKNQGSIWPKRWILE